MDLRIATYNIKNAKPDGLAHLWWCRRRAVLAVIAGLHADVLGVQEAHRFQYSWLARRLGAGWDHGGVGRTDGGWRGEHCPVFARRSGLTAERFETTWFGASPDAPGTRLPGASFPRIATTLVGSLGTSGRGVVVVNTHLDEHLAENRATAMAQLCDALAAHTLPTVIVGDFNARLDAPEMSVLLDAGYRSAVPAGSGGTSHEFTGATDRGQIDHVLVDEHWDVREARIDTTRPGGRLASDHWPVVARLDLRQ